MVTSTLVVAVLAIVVERVVETRFGLAGVIGLLLLRTGIRHRNATCGCVGATVLLMLVLDP
ncbi:hypothetical protein PJ985_10265 [Streptomyces sp. ACA25]|uniref:hypothetical protein n=1 Tax=Streptomyces sp. ACA25 TaxID=3022596 RepID=UPI002307CE8F|nr:hypothetical protein [Streptomyces sp. ACA25]MDB1087949.1 hypothetical protein [Streptomyces sp. ACA25]